MEDINIDWTNSITENKPATCEDAYIKLLPQIENKFNTFIFIALISTIIYLFFRVQIQYLIYKQMNKDYDHDKSVSYTKWIMFGIELYIIFNCIIGLVFYIVQNKLFFW